MTKLEMLQEWQKTITATDSQISALRAVLGMSDCALYESIRQMQCRYTESVARNVGDKSEWLEWFWLENEMGARGHEAGVDDDMRKIKTLDDLLWLVKI